MIGEKATNQATNLREEGKGMKDGERVAKSQKNLDILLQIAVMVMETEIGEDIMTIGIRARETMIDRLLQIDLHPLLDQEIFHDQSRQRLLVEHLPNSGNPYIQQRPLVAVLLAEQAVVAIVPTIVPLRDLGFHCQLILEHQFAIVAAQIMILEAELRLQRLTNCRESYSTSQKPSADV